MSMMGHFIQVSPDRLKQIIDDPSGVEERFVSEPGPLQAMPKLIGALQGPLQGRAPQMLAASIGGDASGIREKTREVAEKPRRGSRRARARRRRR